MFAACCNERVLLVGYPHPRDFEELILFNCISAKDWVYRHKAGRIERIEAYFASHGYDPHRHDTYAIGRTLSGVQNFNYRGTLRSSMPGGTIVLHPDEVHDGHAGTSAGFQYRMIYVEPSLIQQILGGMPLPFLPDGLSSDVRLFQATSALLQSFDAPLSPLEEEDSLYDLATALGAASGCSSSSRSFDYAAAQRAREWIHDNLQENLTLDEMADDVGRDRWSLSRDFRQLFGTSPHRYITMRRLDIAKSCVSTGSSLTDAAMSAGFFDQSHMTRLFKRTFGLSPGRWRALQLRSAEIESISLERKIIGDPFN